MKKGKKRLLKLLGLLLPFALLGLLIFTGQNIRPMLSATAAYHASVYATDLMNEAVKAELEKLQGQELVHIQHNEMTNITSVTLDMLRINQLKTGVTKRIMEELRSEEEEIVEVPLGTLLGSELFSGRGPLVPLILSPMGLASIQMRSGMRQAGINQVLHEVVLSVEVEVSAILPGFSAEARAASDYLIAQTVIVGNVPDRYSSGAQDATSLWETLDEE